jgi:hypothetical protein
MVDSLAIGLLCLPLGVPMVACGTGRWGRSGNRAVLAMGCKCRPCGTEVWVSFIVLCSLFYSGMNAWPVARVAIYQIHWSPSVFSVLCPREQRYIRTGGSRAVFRIQGGVQLQRGSNMTLLSVTLILAAIAAMLSSRPARRDIDDYVTFDSPAWEKTALVVKANMSEDPARASTPMDWRLMSSGD